MECIQVYSSKSHLGKTFLPKKNSVDIIGSLIYGDSSSLMLSEIVFSIGMCPTWSDVQSMASGPQDFYNFVQKCKIKIKKVLWTAKKKKTEITKSDLNDVTTWEKKKGSRFHAYIIPQSTRTKCMSYCHCHLRRVRRERKEKREIHGLFF